ncbi:putative chromate transport protein [Corynebacterium occultum]|uniref:Putative chromate transport protein n=1 Tax=Corynebacterium occultum TaxID=2675219 RepID=A0A6B8VVD4_9CORY|nr:chromate efflux transporter [Corynebacterium occultum]QGU08103.1 putative chromate transport protein [Corynebacterium occultum]
MRTTRLSEVFRSFGLLGLTSFGGPTAHLGYFREEFVRRRAWLREDSYAELIALSHFLPGPSSSQVGMALGYHRAGYAGMFLAWLMFTLPSAVLLGVAALLIDAAGLTTGQGWIAGLLAAAVAVVFHAVSGMAKNMAAGRGTASIAVLSGVLVLLAPTPWTHLALILGAGILGALFLSPDTGKKEPEGEGIRQVSARAAGLSLGLFLLLLGGAVFIGTSDATGWVAQAAAFIQAGSLVFGGGHVVLPLLEQLMVAPGWLGLDEFLAGYSLAQGVPGPMFTFATYLGAVIGGIGGACLATIAIFLPAALLIISGLHFWHRWRALPWLRRALQGVNAAVVGLLGAALYDPVFTHGITNLTSLAIAAFCWLGLAKWQNPPWLIAAGAAAAGGLLL